MKAAQEQLHPLVVGVDLDTSDWESMIPAMCASADIFPGTSKGPKNGENRADQVQLRQEVDKLLPNTTEPEKKEADNLLPNTAQPPKEGDPSSASATTHRAVVWAEVPSDPEPNPVGGGLWAPVEEAWNFVWTGESEGSTMLPLRTVVGKPLPVDSPALGVPRFPLDRDGVVRRYRRRYVVINRLTERGSSVRAEPREMASLPHAVVRDCEPCRTNKDAWDKEELHHSSDDLILNYVGQPYVFKVIDAKYLLQPERFAPKTPSNKNVNDLLSSQIVLIGGTYKEARDKYRTPLGEMAGVDLVAQAVETELRGGVREVSGPTKFLADIFAGLLVIALWGTLSRYIPLGWVFVLTLFGIPAAAFSISTILFSRAIWLDAVAISIGVVMHQVLEEFHTVKEYKDKLEKSESKLTMDDQTIARLEEENRELRSRIPNGGSGPP